MAAVEASYTSTVAFSDAVARTRSTTTETEKRAYYRIIAGETGDQSGRRIRVYAKILKVSAEEFLRPEELRAEAALARKAKPLPTLLELALMVDDLQTTNEKLLDRVERLESVVGELPLAAGGQ